MTGARPVGERLGKGVLLALLAACLPGSPSGRSGPGGSGEAELTRRVAPFEVLAADGVAYEHPFFGGLVAPRPQLVDIDADGDLDLFVHERGGEVMFFENVGTSAADRFVWRTDNWQELPIGEWTRFVDIDSDGRLDLLTEEPYSHVRVYRNDGTPRAPRMVLAVDTLRSHQGRPIFVDRQNIPAFHDLDCDGRLDMFVGRIDGTVARFEAVEGWGANGLPRFELVAERFEGIEIIGEVAGLLQGTERVADKGQWRPRYAATGAAGLSLPSAAGARRRHGANSMFFADADGDGSLDLFWGDFFERGLLRINNRGTCANPSLSTTPVPVYDGDRAIATSGFNAPFLADLNGDGAPDLFLGVLGGAFDPIGTAAANLHHYRNDGRGNFRLVTQRFLHGIDVGSESVPGVGDIDGDGTLDLLVGNKIDPATGASARLYWFRNTGTRSAPRLQLRDTLDLVASYHYAPAVADLWGDALPGLVLGTYTDGIHFFRNVGERGAPRFERQAEMTLQLTRGSNATPAVVDLDGDGRLDLVVGRSNGELSYYRNVGSRTSPRFELVSDRWMGIREGRRSHPTFTDLNEDGLPDLVLGREKPGSAVFVNVGTRTEPRMERDTSTVIPLHPYGSPVFADLYGTGRPVLLSGGASGGVIFFGPVGR